MLTRLVRAAVLLSVLAVSATGRGQNRTTTPGATTVQLPTFGVSIDAAGALKVLAIDDPTGAIRSQRIDAARISLPTDVQIAAPLRKVSLVRLERAWQKKLDAGGSPDEVMLHLAGLCRIRYALLLPEASDIVLVGEAEGWFDDGLGRAVGMATGRPVLRLDDLQTALAAFFSEEPAAGGFIGCTIDPAIAGLERMQQLRAELPRSIPDARQADFAVELDRRTREALGRANVRVFGVAADTHLAAVLVEADYRMKRMAVGVEPAPIRLPSYVERSTGANAAAWQRYWFVPDYARMQTDAARESLEWTGSGVRLQTEDASLGSTGTVQTTPSTDRAASSFCSDFTRQYDAIAARSPVFAELRNMVELLIASAFMRQHDWPNRAGWRPTLLVDRKQATFPAQAAPQSADVVVNTVWKGRRLISAAGGGVSIHPAESLLPENLREIDGATFATQRQSATPIDGDDRWWWD